MTGEALQAWVGAVLAGIGEGVAESSGRTGGEALGVAEEVTVDTGETV